MFLVAPPMSLRPVGSPLRRPWAAPRGEASSGHPIGETSLQVDDKAPRETILIPGPREQPLLSLFEDFEQGRPVTADLMRAFGAKTKVVGAPQPPSAEGAGMRLVDLGAWVLELQAHHYRVQAGNTAV
jgi:hypothetical protein